MFHWRFCFSYPRLNSVSHSCVVCYFLSLFRPGLSVDNEGSHFDMKAYRLMRFSKDMSKVTDCGDILPIASCPWAGRQMWASDMIPGPDGRIYLYFPARDKRDDRFKIGVAVADAPEGPYKAEPLPIQGTYSIDPGALRTSDGSTYLYWGGVMGGQLQNYPDPEGPFVPNGQIPTKGRPLRCRVAKLKPDMKTVDEDGVQEVVIRSNSREIKASDQERMFFEGPFAFERMHEGKPLYYLLYSTGWTHLIQHATASKPTGPFKWRGVVLTEPKGWTSQVSMAEYRGRWWLFYHDAARSGETHLRGKFLLDSTKSFALERNWGFVPGNCTLFTTDSLLLAYHSPLFYK